MKEKHTSKNKKKAIIKNGKEINNVPEAVGEGLAGNLKIKQRW